jgi:hypothetical protein
MSNPAHDIESTPVPLHNMLHDGEAQSGAASLPGTGRIRPIKALCQARHVFRRNAFAFIRHRDANPSGLPLFQRDADLPVRRPIFERILHQVAQDLRQLTLIA